MKGAYFYGFFIPNYICDRQRSSETSDGRRSKQMRCESSGLLLDFAAMHFLYKFSFPGRAREAKRAVSVYRIRGKRTPIPSSLSTTYGRVVNISKQGAISRSTHLMSVSMDDRMYPGG